MSHKTMYCLSSLLRNSSTHSVISQTKQVHTQILINNYITNVTLQTDLLLAYSRRGFLYDARKIFDRMSKRNMHSWNILISSYVQNSLYIDAIFIFNKFLKVGFRPDHYTFPPLFKASAAAGDRYLGWMLHARVIKVGFEEYIVVGSSVLDFYVKFGELTYAKRVFSNLSFRDSCVWNLIISGFGRHSFYAEALTLFKCMLEEGVEVDAFTIPSVLNSCGGEGNLMKGKEIHVQVVKSALYYGDVAIGNSLIDMYAKCGCLCDSRKVFSNMHYLNLVTWTTMIFCYGIHGKGDESLALFKVMKDCGFKPNRVTLTAVLAGCNHSGLIDEAQRIFYYAWLDYGFEPSMEHYACMVDLLGRFGHLEEALGLVQNMKVAATSAVWGALLAGCVMHKDVKIGEIAAHYLFELEPRNCSNFIALCCIYESHGIWDGILITRAKMKELGLVKTPGCSWITISGIIHKFYQGDNSCPCTKVALETLDGMIKSPTLADDLEGE